MYVDLMPETVLYKRMLKSSVPSENPDDYQPAVFIAVTQESNCFAVWYHAPDTKIIALSSDRDAAIQYAVRVAHVDAAQRFKEQSVIYLRSQPPELDEIPF